MMKFKDAFEPRTSLVVTNAGHGFRFKFASCLTVNPLESAELFLDQEMARKLICILEGSDDNGRAMVVSKQLYCFLDDYKRVARLVTGKPGDTLGITLSKRNMGRLKCMLTGANSQPQGKPGPTFGLDT